MFLLIGDLTWQLVAGPNPLKMFTQLIGVARPTAIPLTPRTQLWIDQSPTNHQGPYTLPSALTTLFSYSTWPIHGPACLTATDPLLGLDATQVAAFTHLLTRLGDPTVLARHRTAARTFHHWHATHEEMHHDNQH